MDCTEKFCSRIHPILITPLCGQYILTKAARRDILKSNLFLTIKNLKDWNIGKISENVRRRPTTDEKCEKTPVVGRRNVKNAENCPSSADNQWKTAKTGLRRVTMNKNQRKSAFPHGGKSKISENQLSLTGENQKSVKINFPSRGKIKNRQKTVFPRGGTPIL